MESADYPDPLGYHERDPELDLRLLENQREQLEAHVLNIAAKREAMGL